MYTFPRPRETSVRPGGAERVSSGAALAQPQHADWIGTESQTMRDLYERGAGIRGEILTIPAEEHEIPQDNETPFITTLSYAQRRIGNIEGAQEFHSLALAISGKTADARMQIVVFKHYYDRIARHEQGASFGRDREAELSGALKRTLEEMRSIAAEMAKFETRESIEAVESEKNSKLDSSEDRTVTNRMNVSARKVNLRDTSLRFPAELNYETKVRIVTRTLPEIDQRLESGIHRGSLFKAVDNTFFHSDPRDLTDREVEERARIASFIKSYIHERLRDPETRALNTSATFREARAAIINAATPEALGQAATSILRSNEQRGEELRRHRANPYLHALPEVMPLNSRERNLLFNGRAPEHHTREMCELRLNYGLSRGERSQRAADLREGRTEPSDALKTMLLELGTRKTAKAVAHFQASVLNDQVNATGRANFFQLYQQIAPHERTYLFELSEERKKDLRGSRRNAHAESVISEYKEDGHFTGRSFGQAPRDSQSFREYMANLGLIERQLLNEAVGRLTPSPNYKSDLTITEARALLPEKRQDEIRLRARNLAWQSLVPNEVFEREPFPEALRISDTIAHLQDHLQDRARIAQTARNDFIAERLRGAKERPQETTIDRISLHKIREDHQQPIRVPIDSLSPADTHALAALDHYAAQTREDVYRGFETLDLQWRDLETARGRWQFNRVFENDSLRLGREVAFAGENPARENLQPPNLHAVTQIVVRNDQRDRLEEAQAHKYEIGEKGLQPGYVNTDQLWHLDSLRNIIGDGQIEENILPRELERSSETYQFHIDR